MKLSSKKILAVISATVLAISSFGGISMANLNTVEALDNARTVTINGNSTSNDKMRLGTVTANNSSRLLLDYKAKTPKAYWEIMNYLFNKETGIGLSHIKIEMGSDSDSSSGTEPAVKRAENEVADVTRGAGYQFAADAKTINPDITIDMLRWGAPAWVNGNGPTSEDNMALRYKWYKETVDAAFDTYGLKFDYISADRNETGDPDVDWIKYLRKHLDNETDERYDYGTIKLVASDEVTSDPKISGLMLKDAALRNAVDVIGVHYSTWCGENTLKLKNTYNKEIWYSEGSASTIDSILGMNATNASGDDLDDVAKGTGLTGVNSTLEIATRIANMYCQDGTGGGGMNLYEFQPAVAAYYQGAIYVPKQLIMANTPWNGYYNVQSAFWMAAHFTRFQTDGMRYVKGACYGDGEAGGDGHAVVNTTQSYISMADKSTGDYTMVIVNNSSETRNYNVEVKNLSKQNSQVIPWTTKAGSSTTNYDDNWLKKGEAITPVENGDTSTFEYSVEPYSIVTLTTTTGQKSYADQKSVQSKYEKTTTDTTMSIPYTDNFEYTDEFLASRGSAPLYTTDQAGAFEVVKKSDGNKVLRQVINVATKPTSWGSTGTPSTNLGDDRWADYSVSIDGYFDTTYSQSFIGVGLRSSGAVVDSGNKRSGYWVQLGVDGKYTCYKNTKQVGGATITSGDAIGTIESFDATKKHTLKVVALDKVVSYYIDGKLVCKINDTVAPVTSGRVSIYSSLSNNEFDNLSINSENGGVKYITRVDALKTGITYTGDWTLNCGASYKYYNRTNAVSSKAGDSLSYTFTGTGISVLSGATDAANFTLYIDGKAVKSNYALEKQTFSRTTAYSIRNLAYGKHTFKLVVNSGSLTVDSLEVYGQPNIKLSTCTFGAIANKTYTAKSQTPDITVKYGSATLVKNTDYTVSYSNNVNAGTAKITIKGKGNITGTVTKTFKIVGKKLTSSRFSLSTTKYTYTGTAKKPTVKATGLKLNKDYTVSYSSNIYVGTGKVTIKGKGNYSGTVTKYFKIVKPTVAKTSITKLTTGKKAVKVTFKKISGAVKYKVQICSNKSFKGARTGYTTSSAIKFTKLTSKKKYYVRVAAVKKYKTSKSKAYYPLGKYSTIKAVRPK